MIQDTDAAKRLAAHLARLEAEIATLDAHADDLAEQAAAPLPGSFDEPAARVELANAQATDIATGGDTARSVAERIAADREAAEQARQAAEDGREQAAEDLAQLRATREALRVQADTTRDLLRSEVQRAAAAVYRDAHGQYRDALEQVIAAAARVQGAALLLMPPDPYSGGRRSAGAADVFTIEVPNFALGRIDSGNLPPPEGVGSGNTGPVAVLNRDHAARLVNEAAARIYVEITGAEA